MSPTVGRIVHFYRATGEKGVRGPHPAIVTAVHDKDCVNLTVFFDNRPIENRTSVVRQPDVDDGFPSWVWAPREGAPSEDTPAPRPPSNYEMAGDFKNTALTGVDASE